MKPLTKEHVSLKLPAILRSSEDHSSGNQNTDRKNKKSQKNRKSPPLPQSLPTTVNRRYEMEVELKRKAHLQSKHDILAGMGGSLNMRNINNGNTTKQHVSMSSTLALEVRKKIRSLREPSALDKSKQSKRQSKLLLFKNMESTKKKKNLGYLLEYEEDPTQKQVSIQRRTGRYKLDTKSAPRPPAVTIPRPSSNKGALRCDYNTTKLTEIEFLKLFILQQLNYFLSQTVNRSKEEMLGFCRIYMENTDKVNHINVCSTFHKRKAVEQATILEKLCLYVVLLLSTDTAVNGQTETHIRNLTNYTHKNNLLVLDVRSFLDSTAFLMDAQLLMNIVEIEKAPVTLQFHIYNTMRFNQDRRKISYDGDPIELLSKNSIVIRDLLKTIITDCPFESLKAFATDILGPEGSFEDKFDQIAFVIASLVNTKKFSYMFQEQIIEASLRYEKVPPRPDPPFLPPNPCKPYTLVLDLDETLIHYKETDSSQSFLVRPYCQDFLQQMSKLYEIVIFTASVKDYADSILDILDREKWISYRLYRQHTRFQDYVSIKDISMLGRDLSKSIIIDNIPANFKLQSRNGIYITTWVGDEQDTCLLNLIPVLSLLVHQGVKDVRDGLEEISKYMEKALQDQEPLDLDKLKLNC